MSYQIKEIIDGKEAWQGEDVPDNCRHRDGNDKLQQPSLKQKTGSVKEKRNYGRDNIFGALIAHSQQLDCVNNALRDGGDCKKMTGLGHVGLDDEYLAGLVWNSLRGAE